MEFIPKGIGADSILANDLFSIIALRKVILIHHDRPESLMKTDSLHRFLHSINLGEQRMCKKVLASDKGKWAKQRMRLFDTLMRQETYDTAKLAKAIGDAAYLKELPTEKHRMFKRLMHTVMEHRAIGTDNVDPMEKLRESQLLFSLGMRQEAIATAHAGLERSRQIGDPLSETCLREHLRQVHMYGMTAEDLPLLEHNGELLVAAAERTVSIMQLHVESDKVERLFERYRMATDSRVREELDRYMSHPLLNSYTLSFSQLATLRNYRVSAMYQEAIGNLNMALNFMGLTLTSLEKFPAHSQMWPELLISCTSDLIYLHVRLGWTAMAQDLLQGLEEQVNPQTRRDRAMAFAHLEVSRQRLQLGIGDPQGVLANGDRVREQLEHYGDLIPDGLRLSLCYNIGMAHLILGNDGQALAMFSCIRDMGRRHVRLDLQGIARLFRLLLLMERDTHDSFDHYLRNSRRFFCSDHPSYPVEDVVLRWLASIKRNPDGTLPGGRLSDLYAALAPMAKQGLAGAAALRAWARSRAGVKLRPQEC